MCGISNNGALSKWDSDGNQLWNETLGGYSLWSDGAGAIYTCGNALVKWDLDGNQIWNKTFNAGLHPFSLDLWGDGVGAIYTCGKNSSDLMVVKWDTAGIPVWNRTWNGTGMGSFLKKEERPHQSSQDRPEF
jgi:hypothetical protein